MNKKRSHEPFRAPSRNLFSDPELALFSEKKFNVVDGGAAGEMFAPFDATPEDICVYSFEPRATESERDHMHKPMGGGIWSEQTRKALHVAKVPETSSIYPPNIPLLQYFEDRYGAPPRETEKRIEVELFSIDAAVEQGLMLPPNFLKLDVHSSEYEALIGAQNSLSECLGVLVEVWHLEVHKGQALSGKVEKFLNDAGFVQFSSRQNISWFHSFEGQTLASDRPHVVGAENLYLRWDPPEHLAAAHVALLELFGFSALARRRLTEDSGAIPPDLRLRMIAALDENIRVREAEAKEAARQQRLEKKRYKAFLAAR
ncbi:hypothetical protein HFP57_03530 [Parasphingopyxis algicola]|uniref:FkbM family methyltransferase n=1 Tax=Parasphingopyxis algicola TaxID=2026624 RepID=UPI0015A2E1AB|nr:FkbM family methyltransferase [Parasphingopyxis algicola]QLC24189.1 hypothetical protein HFP57_03530 [Parasphingopyxis algicola]